MARQRKSRPRTTFAYSIELLSPRGDFFEARVDGGSVRLMLTDNEGAQVEANFTVVELRRVWNFVEDHGGR